MPNVDTVLSVLNAPRRRMTLRALAEGPTDHRTLAERLTAAEQDLALDAVTYDDRQGIHTALTQVHLPKLSEYEAVVWDRESGYVAPGRHHALYFEALCVLERIDGVDFEAERLPD